jgi:hypothetical protein
MPCSKKQLAANRRNAKMSTGPRTPEGKAVSSRNALKHGIFSADTILKFPPFNENRKHYHRVRDLFMKELAPTSSLQKCLATEIINTVWRSRRVVRAKNAIILKQSPLSHVPSPPTPVDDSLPPESLALLRACLAGLLCRPRDTSIYNILRYEREMDGRIDHLYRMLLHLQMIESL